MSFNRSILLGAIVGVFGASTACGGSGDTSVFGTTGSASASSSATSGPGSTGSGGATSSSVSSGAGGSTGTGAGGSAQSIDPIAVGHAWTYDVTELGTFAYCPSGPSTATTLGESQVDGKDAFEVTSLCKNLPSSFYSVAGDVVQVDYQHTWILALDAPVQEGHTWSNGSSTFTWHAEPSVTVPAGTFTDCWRATQNVSYEAYTVFCRGVGPVHWRSKDLSGNGFDAVLSGKNF